MDFNIIPMKRCVEVLGYTQPPSQVNHPISLTTPMDNVPTFTSNIMGTSTQNVIPTSVSQGDNSSNHNSFIPPQVSFPFVTQSFQIPTYNSVSPPYSKPPPSYIPPYSQPPPSYNNITPPPSFNNVTPPSQSNMSNFNSSTEATINSLAPTVSSLQKQIASMSQSKYSVPTFDVVRPLSNNIVCVVPPKRMEVPQL